MLLNFLHTTRCNGCGKIYQSKKYSQGDKCKVCKGELEYRGFQPEMDALTIMTMELEQSFGNKQTENVEIAESVEKEIYKYNKEINKKEYCNDVIAKEINEEEANEFLKQEGIIEEEINEVKQEELNETKQDEMLVEEKQENVVVETSQEEYAITNSELTIDMILDTSGRISNAQVIPALKEAISESSIEKILLIKNHYPEVFNSSLKYIGKKNLASLNNMLDSNL